MGDNLKVGSSVCQCPTCLHYFGSVSAFDMHRTGDYDKGTRRCWTEREMLHKGMARNAKGYWVTRLYDGPHQHKDAAA